VSTPRLTLVSGWGTDERAMYPVRTLLEPSFPCEYVPWWDCLGENDALGQRLESSTAPVVLVGWSLGCQIGLRAAAARPGDVAALVLVSGTPRMTAIEDYPGAPLRALRTMRAKLRADPAAVLADFGALCLAPEENALWVAEFTRMATEIDATHDCLAAGLRALQDTDLRAALAKIECPALVLHGEADHVVPVESARFMAAALPRGELRLVPDGTHAMLHTNPNRIEHEIRSFLDVHFL
jgi:pimeloyl-ACP methyl ester carboxylesterase